MSSDQKPPRQTSKIQWGKPGKWRQLAPCLALVALLAGCDSTSPPFQLDMVWVLINDDQENPFSKEQLRNVSEVLTGAFGTPDKPHVLAGVNFGIDDIIDGNLLAMSAGPVGVGERGRHRGLYRRHCAHCHGVSGDGAGPTAQFLNPFPRDYRMGVFKFKSTPKGEKPTDADLERILRNGIPGTAMPSFALLADDEIDSLVDYVKYLSMRGEVERNLVLLLKEEVEEDQLLMDPNNPAEGIGLFQEAVDLVVTRWRQAESRVTVPSPRPSSADPHTATADELQQSIARGYEIFHGVVANCFSCHGKTALGDGQLDLYDKWTEQWVDPKTHEVFEDRLARLDRPLVVRNIRPRNLRLGVYRGGRRPLDLYWRLRNGIDGAEMPAVPIRSPNDPPEKKGLTESDLWDLINYVRSLPYEQLSHPPYRLHEHDMQLDKPI